MLFSPSFLSATPFSVTTAPKRDGVSNPLQSECSITRLTDKLSGGNVETGIVNPLPRLVTLSHTFRANSNDRKLASLCVETSYLSSLNSWAVFDVDSKTKSQIRKAYRKIRVQRTQHRWRARGRWWLRGQQP